MSDDGPVEQPEALSDGWRNYVDLRKMLKALSDDVRLNIVHMLAVGGEVNVTELAETLAVSQPLISWHLGALRRAGLVQTQRHGREVYCTLDLSRYHLCQRMLSKVLEPEAQGETGTIQREPRARKTRAASRAVASKALPASQIQGPPERW